MRNAFLALLWFFYTLGWGQINCADMELYIPYNSTTHQEVPPVNVKVKVHVIQHSDENPQNFTVNDTAFIDTLIKQCNLFLRLLEEPTLQPPVEINFFRDARVALHLKSIDFYQDSLDWDRLYIGPHISKEWPKQVDSVDLTDNALLIKGKHIPRLRSVDSIRLIEAGANSGIYHIAELVYVGEYTKALLKEPLSTSVAAGKFTYFQEYNKNCNRDIWEKYTASDSNHLHIFFTGCSNCEVSFGCGPSPYFLNFSRVFTEQLYSTAQLLTHEIGHCLGLFHTDYPQFDDLPKKDKFCWCLCDDKEVSNNIMGYNICRRHLSPKQVGHIHKGYNTNPHRIRTRSECTYHKDSITTIYGTAHWDRGYVLSGDLVVKRRASLTVNCLLSMPEGSSIFLEKKAQLIVNGTITNSCGSHWEGIKILNKRGLAKKKTLKPHKRGVLIVTPDGKLERIGELANFAP
jgi:hypothetical protein